KDMIDPDAVPARELRMAQAQARRRKCISVPAPRLLVDQALTGHVEVARNHDVAFRVANPMADLFRFAGAHRRVGLEIGTAFPTAREHRFESVAGSREVDIEEVEGPGRRFQLMAD